MDRHAHASGQAAPAALIRAVWPGLIEKRCLTHAIPVACLCTLGCNGVAR